MEPKLYVLLASLVTRKGFSSPVEGEVEAKSASISISRQISVLRIIPKEDCILHGIHEKDAKETAFAQRR